MKSREFLIILLAAVAFGVAGVYVGLREFADPPAQSSNDTDLLNRSFTDLQNHPVSMAQWKGKTLVVNFWATWCSPCVEEMPELSHLQNQLREKNVQIIGIGLDSTQKMQDFATKYRIAYPLYAAGADGLSLIRQMGNVKGGLPFTLILKPDGSVKKTYLGRLDMRLLKQDLGLF